MKKGKEKKYTKKKQKKTCKNLQRKEDSNVTMKSTSYKLDLPTIIEISPSLSSPANQTLQNFVSKKS